MRVIALEYHDVVAGDPDQSGFPGPAAATYKLAAETFEAHLEAIAGSGIAVGVAAAPALAALRSVPVLTFDDGGASYASQTAGRLEAHGWRGHLYVTTDCIGTSGFLDGRALRDLHARGHAIGSHSCSHPTRMSACTRSQLRDEWTRSIATLSDLLGAPVSEASVPGGYFSRAVAEEAGRAGVKVLFTSEPTSRVVEIEGCAVLGRFTLRRWHDAAYVARLTGRSPTARAGQWLQWNGKKVAKALGGSLYLETRARLLRP